MISEKEMEEIELKLKEAEINAQNTQAQTQVISQESLMGEQQKSIVKEQLDLGEELDRIDHLLKGDVLTEISPGYTDWREPKDKSMIILSPHGVHLIRNTMAWYMNKNTLLSNYDEETINMKMLDFTSDLNDTIFMEYERVFQYPSFEECKNALKERLKKKQELKEFARELIGKPVNEEERKEIEEKILKDIEPIIEKELSKIKEQMMKDKLKRFLIIIREVQDAVHSTYLRAWKGQERETLRRNVHINENRGGLIQPREDATETLLSKLRRRR